MKNNLIFFLFCGFFWLSAVGVSAQNQTNISSEISTLLEKKRIFNKNYGFGYRVQIYYGNETEARTLQNRFQTTYPEVFTKLEYDRPYWKVKVGNYKTKLEADRASMVFSDRFSGLIVVPIGK